VFASCGARVSIQRNRISNNALAAVYCTNGACADVEANEISECLHSGIVFVRCLGSIVGNRLHGIGGNGIVVGMVCAPLLQGNAVEEVAGAGVVCEAGSQAVVRSNQIARCKVGLLLQVTPCSSARKYSRAYSTAARDLNMPERAICSLTSGCEV
jgi:hypothetical protein